VVVDLIRNTVIQHYRVTPDGDGHVKFETRISLRGDDAVQAKLLLEGFVVDDPTVITPVAPGVMTQHVASGLSLPSTPMHGAAAESGTPPGPEAAAAAVAATPPPPTAGAAPLAEAAPTAGVEPPDPEPLNT